MKEQKGRRDDICVHLARGGLDAELSTSRPAICPAIVMLARTRQVLQVEERLSMKERLEALTSCKYTVHFLLDLYFHSAGENTT